MAVDTAHVIWMTATAPGGGAGSLHLCPKTGCSGPPTTLAVNRNTGALAGNGGVAYASFTYATNEIVRVEGASIVSIPPISYHETALNLAMRGSTLYIDAFYEGDGGQPRSIFAFEEPAKETLLGFFPGGTGGSIINTTPFTVSDKAIFLGVNNFGRIVKCDIPGCATWTDFLDGETAYANTLTTDDKRLFWTGSVAGYVYSCPVEGATCSGTKTEVGPAVLGTGKAIFAKIDRGTLFITTSDGRILTCDPGSCTATVREIARETKLAGTYALFGPPFAADALALYYAAVDETDGAPAVSRIMKLAR